MSERSSFTSEYIYNSVDYSIVYEALKAAGPIDDKYFCLAPQATWGDFKMPIIQGKIGELAANSEWIELHKRLAGVETTESVRFVIICDGGEIHLITKNANGSIKMDVLASCGEHEGLTEDNA